MQTAELARAKAGGRERKGGRDKEGGRRKQKEAWITGRGSVVVWGAELTLFFLYDSVIKLELLQLLLMQLVLCMRRRVRKEGVKKKRTMAQRMR